MTKIIVTLLLISGWLLTGCAEETEDPAHTQQVTIGAETLVSEHLDLIEHQRVGIVTNHSAVVGDTHLIDVLDDLDIEITALFGPEHGIRGEVGAGVPVEDGIDQATGAPIYSLYGDTREPTPEMLEDVDVLIFDIQDIGARFYTYISTMGYTMQGAAEKNISYIVLDRPNPLGGEKTEGFMLEEEHKSFVGLYPIPVTHGMTVSELAVMIKEEQMLDGLENLELHTMELENWARDMLWPDTQLDWVEPSPNIPDFETALIYPGACYFEGTNISEGRGTYQPFLKIGAPWADNEEIADELNSREIPGIEFEPVTFTPESIEGMAETPKLEGEELQGIRYNVYDIETVEPMASGIHVLEVFYQYAPEDEKDDFFSEERMYRLGGTDRLYNKLVEDWSAEEIVESWTDENTEFQNLREAYLKY